MAHRPAARSGRGAAHQSRPPRRAAAGKRAAKRQPDKTREGILAAAVVEFSTHGLDGARVDAIARLAGANKRMIYHYFGNKEDLYLAALERVYADRRASDRRFDAAHDDPREALAALIRFNFDYFADHPEFITMLNNENLSGAKHLGRSTRVRELHSPLIDRIGELLRRGEEHKLFRPGVDPVQLYISITALGYFYFSNRWTLSRIFGRDFGSARARAARREHVIAVILGYLHVPT
jgi:AcrR family transcriptional regulator